MGSEAGSIPEPLVPRVQYLKKELDWQIPAFDKRRRANWGVAKFFRVSLFIVGTVTTILVGLNAGDVKINGLDPAYLKIGALIFSATATGLAGAEAFFNARALWVSFNEAWTGLLHIQAQLLYREAAAELTSDFVDKLFDSHQAVLARVNSNWAAARQTTPQLPKP